MAAESSTKDDQEHETCSPLALVATSPRRNPSPFFANFSKAGERRNPSYCVLRKDGEGGVPRVEFLIIIHQKREIQGLR